MNVLLEKDTELTEADKALFGSFGVGSRIRPPYRILNPQCFHIGRHVSIREGAFLNAYTDLTVLHGFVDPAFRGDFAPDDYRYAPRVDIGDQVQIGRFMLMSCTAHIEIEAAVVFSDRTFVGDNNHSARHPEVPIVFQPNKAGRPVRIGRGSWIGVGACVLAGTSLGRNTVVGANAVVRGDFPDRAVLGPPMAEVWYVRE